MQLTPKAICAAVALLCIGSASFARQESRGLHYTLDYPETDTAHPPRDTVLVPGNWALAERMPGW